MMTCYACSIVGGALRLGEDEVAEARWVTRDEALALPR